MSVEEARESLSDEMIAEFKMAFDIFDHDGGGDINTNELGRVMKLLGQSPSKDELDQIVEAVDVDGSGSIDFDEFLIMMVMQLKEENKSASDEEVKEIFRLFDKNGDNFLDWDELNGALANIGSDPPVEKWEVDEIFNEVDGNGDGVIDVEEFTNWLTH